MICTFLRFFVYCFRLLLFVADSDGAELKTQLATNNRFPLAYTWTLNGWHAPHNRLAAQLEALIAARLGLRQNLEPRTHFLPRPTGDERIQRLHFG